MPSYDAFAPYYDAAMGDVTDKAAWLRGLIHERLPAAQTVLEFACGTGAIMQALAESYAVSGLDLSPEMVKRAQAKLPSADIRTGNMDSYTFDATFDVVLCAYDSINHLQDWEDWSATFANAAQHLRPGGLFIFDINTSRRLQWLADRPAYTKQLGDDTMIMDVARADDAYLWDVKIFAHDHADRYRLHQDAISEVSFPIDEVTAELESFFTVEDIVDVRNLSPDDPQWRPFFICRKS